MSASIDFPALRAGAAAGDARSQLMLAYCAIAGKPGAPSVEEGEQLLAAACAQNLPEALLMLAGFTARGVGRTADSAAAYALVQQAAQHGSLTAKKQLAVLGEETFDRAPWVKPFQSTQISDSPRMFSIDGFIPDAACDWLIERAVRKGMQAAVVNMPDGRLGVHPDRNNSMSGYVQSESDLVVQLVQQRIARATDTPLSHHEPTTVFRYGPGEQYKPHFDFVAPGTPEAAQYEDELAAVGMRMATVLVYLNDGYSGGETSFPRLQKQYKGKKGDALIFWSLSEDGVPDRNSLHGGNPVTRGEKWLLSQWIRQKPYPFA
jgi:prolyl 4-hydroxylase